MFSITKDFTFAAAHRLNGLAPDHQCSRLHGHNYIVRVEVTDLECDKDGFVVDYGLLAPIRRFIDDHLDHRFLNDALPEVNGPDQPSAELMAEWLAKTVRDLVPAIRPTSAVAVGISETANSWAWFRS